MTGLLLGGLLSINAIADTYIGVDYGVVSNTDKGSNGWSGEQDNPYTDLKIKIGSGEDGGWKAQASLSFITMDKIIFPATTSKDLIELGFDVIKEFEITKSVYPFIKAGLGYGSMSLNNSSVYNKDSINEVSFNAGAGLAYKVIDSISVMVGVDYIGRRWQDIQTATSTLETTGSGTKIYGGVNYNF